MKKACLYLSLFIVIGALSTGCSKKVEKKAENENAVPVVHLKKELQDSMKFAIEDVKKEKFRSSIEVYGSIAQDTENTTHVTCKESGVLKSFKKTVGDTVEPGDVVAIMTTNSGQEREVASSLHGVILSAYVKEGDRIDTLTSIATIANPDIMRASFDVYEKDLGFVKLGQEVLVTSISYPGKEFSGKVVFVSPGVDEVTRTIKIRVDVENKDHLLKFGMAVTGKVIQESEEESIVIPAAALQSLEDGWVVFIQKEVDSFEARRVEKGRENATQAEIIKGISEGEKVVASGSFTLKSELLKDQLGAEE